ncbi:hypothetical protein NDU88_005468 [Pleurodeles waltl]|uniref:Uncharacterized protein n=1 Tax=Pleurodeles waltl TaxID=8319 RepID=A0AAV7VNA3_PLEWA|nr:hypothetical protein NDU88_005468 [Pleurodeles waltl]
MPLWGRKKNGSESGRQHGAEARSIPGWLATDPFSGVAGLLNRWAASVLWEALDEKVTPLLVEDAVESVKLRGAKLELKAAGQVGWLFLSSLRMVYRKTKLRDEVAALQERQLLMKETIESAVTRGDQMEARQMPAEPLFKWLVGLWVTGAKDALQNPFTLGPITEGDPFELEMIVQDYVDDVVMWSLWQRKGKKRVPQDWALVETERITDYRRVTLKTWVPLLGWTREGGDGNKVDRAQEFAIVKWKWYLQQRAKPGPAGVS